jgi:hypothetical protein
MIAGRKGPTGTATLRPNVPTFYCPTDAPGLPFPNVAAEPLPNID